MKNLRFLVALITAALLLASVATSAAAAAIPSGSSSATVSRTCDNVLSVSFLGVQPTYVEMALSNNSSNWYPGWTPIPTSGLNNEPVGQNFDMLTLRLQFGSEVVVEEDFDVSNCGASVTKIVLEAPSNPGEQPGNGNGEGRTELMCPAGTTFLVKFEGSDTENGVTVVFKGNTATFTTTGPSIGTVVIKSGAPGGMIDFAHFNGVQEGSFSTSGNDDISNVSFCTLVVQPPVVNPPVENPPVVNPPVENPPVVNPPVENPPVVNPPVENPPVVTSPPNTGAGPLSESGMSFVTLMLLLSGCSAVAYRFRPWANSQQVA